MTFQSISNFLLGSFLVIQTVQAQVPGRVGSPPTLQEQGPQDQKTDRDSGNGDGSTTEKASIPDPLLSLLVSKGLLTTQEARVILSGDPANQRDLLATLLRNKGLISATEFDQLRATASNNTAVTAGALPQGRSDAANSTSTTPGPSQKPSAPSVIAAIAPT